MKDNRDPVGNESQEPCLWCSKFNGHYGWCAELQADSSGVPKSTQTPMEDSLETLFEVAVSEWENQGRSDEEKFAVRNFLTGRGIALKQDVNALIKNARNEGRIDELKNVCVEIGIIGDVSYDRQISAGYIWERLVKRKKELEK